MGFARANALPMLREHKRRRWSGHGLCLGQADVHFSYETLAAMAMSAGVELVKGAAPTLSHRPDLAAKGYISRETLFASLGFAQVSALDVSAFEGAEIQFDLNSASLPESLAGKFDAVLDHGTMEHVFHVPNCLSNIHGMLKEGGRVIHTSPTSNYVDHGFYMFSPTFFHDFYSANAWEIRVLQLVRLNPQQQELEAPFFADYAPGLFDHTSAGGLAAGAYLTVCIAEKTAASTGHVVPQQGYYRRTLDWQPEQEPAGLEDIRLVPPFQRERANCWVRDLLPYAVEDGDSMAEPRRSWLRLFEGDLRLGPAHSLHDAIRDSGRGAYSHWGNLLYFSSSDNSDPNSNGRSYRARVRRRG